MRLRRLVLLALVIYAAWTLAGIFFSTQQYLVAGGEKVAGKRIDWVLPTLVETSVWALITPFVMFVAERFPLRRPTLFRNTAVMLLFAIAVAGGRAMLNPRQPFGLSSFVVPRLDFFTALVAVFHTHFLFALVLIGITNFLRLLRESAERSRAEVSAKAALAQARLRRLRADLHPHFLFNALNAVAALVHTNPAAAERTIDTLSELLRRSIATEDSTEVRLADDIEFIERYLDLQKTRFGDRLRSRVAVDPALLDAAVPPLLVQPLVENAIVHSISKRSDGGAVEVIVTRHDRWLCVDVRDDGDGNPRTILARGGVGVTNARERLESLYGEEQSLTFRRDRGMFVAAVRMPLRMLDARLAS